MWLLLLLLLLPAVGYADDTGIHDAGTCAVEGTGQAWSSVTECGADEDSRASVGGTSASSEELVATNYGFDADIGASDTIDGIDAAVNRRENFGGTCTDDLIKLYNGGQVGDDKQSATAWPASEGDATYGGAADDWNASQTTADIRSSGFGMILSVFMNGLTFCDVDAMRLRVTFTVSSGDRRIFIIGQRILEHIAPWRQFDKSRLPQSTGWHSPGRRG